MIKTNRKSLPIIGLSATLLALSCLMHLYRLGEVPNGFFYDESSIGYNAYSILQTGKDEYGISYPLFFKSFDNYQDPIMVYSAVPSIKIFGLNKFAVRLVSALFHLLASIAFAFLVYEYSRDILISVIASFVFSVLPWSFPLSRISLAGYTPMLLGLALSCLFMIKMMKSNYAKFAVLSGVFWGFTMYSHNCGRPVAAAMLICFIIAFNKSLIKRWKIVSTLFATLFLMLIPLVLVFLSNPDCLTNRFYEISLYHKSPDIGSSVYGVIIRYIEYFSPFFLFLLGDSNLRHNIGLGQLYFFIFPLLVIGIFAVWRKRKNPYLIYVFLAILVYPVASVLTIDHMHGTRTVNAAIPFLLLASIGAKYFLVTKKNAMAFRMLLIVFLVFASLEIFNYLNFYFSQYPDLSRNDFHAPLVESIERAFQEKKSDETVYASGSLFHHPVDDDFKAVWYSHFIFFGKIDPSVYQQKGIPRDIVSYYHPDHMPRSGLLLRMNSKIVFDKNYKGMVALNDEPIPDNSKLISSIPIIRGSDRFFELYRFSNKENK